MRWDRCVRCSIRMLAFFNWRDAGSSWRSSTARINSAATAAIPCTPAKPSGQCYAATAANATTRKSPRALSSPSVGMILSCWRSILAIATALAGFVEVGETLEQTVAREVMEESGIKVKNLRYVTSQPWPFPQSLMTAFMAEYDSGEIVIDKKELLEAGWYRYDNLPLLPPPGTVARRLIEDTVAMCRAEYE